jgi:small subunit ribosomal protein S3Ae
MMATKNVTAKKKKKAWYGLYAPESLNGVFLGETQVYAPDEMIGKSLSMNLAMITGDMKKQNVIASFIVNEVKDNKGMAKLIGYSLSAAYIKRLVRRKRDKIDDSFLAKSKDGTILRIKTVVMTNSKTHESATSAIRLSLRAKIKKALTEVDFNEFVNSLINLRLQKDWKNSLGKIYPLKFLEVRHVSLETPKKSMKDEEYKDYTEKVKSDDDLEDYEDKESADESDVKDVESEDVEDVESDDEKVESVKTKDVEVEDIEVEDDVDDDFDDDFEDSEADDDSDKK